MSDGKHGYYWIWPAISDLPNATRASDGAFWAAIFVAGVTAGFATFALVSGKQLASIDASAYLDAAAFGFIAWRIKKRSRAFAVIGLAMFLFEKAVQIAQNPSAGSGFFMALILALLFIGGIRGNFAIHTFSSVPTSSLPSSDA